MERGRAVLSLILVESVWERSAVICISYGGIVGTAFFAFDGFTGGNAALLLNMGSDSRAC